MKQSLLKLGVFGDEVYCITQHGIILNRETMKPAICVCGNFLTCEVQPAKRDDFALTITKKMCSECGEIN